MRHPRLLIGAALVAIFGIGLTVFAWPERPYRNGSVWNVVFVRIKPGMGELYLNYLAGQWKATQEAMKKEGLVLSYMVMETEAHSSTDWNLMLMTEYKDLATMEANEDKFEQVAERIVGDDQKQQQGYRERSEVREVIGDRLARQIILEPKR